MSMIDDLDLDDMDLEEDASPPEEASNRTFLMVAGGLGAILILSLICIAVYAFFYVPSSRGQRETQEAEVNAQNTEVAMFSAQTAAADAAAAWTPTSTATQRPQATKTSTQVIPPTNTPVVGLPTDDPRTATVAALLTIQAGGASDTETPTPTPTLSPTALPDTGFADDVGIPGLLALAAALLVIIFFARRLRTTS